MLTARGTISYILVTASSGTFLSTPGKPTMQRPTLTYLANEGVLISDGHRAVLIDALFREGVSGYARVEADTLEKLESAAEPYDTIRVVLVTHYHKDHFDAESVARHVRANSKAVLITSEQAAKPILDQATEGDEIKKRIRAFSPKPMEKVESTHAGVTVELFKMSHGGGRFASVWNLGYIVHVGGTRFLHIGDAHPNPASLDPLTQFAKSVDVACLPYWWLTSKRSIDYVKGTLKPKHIVAMHVPPREVAQVERDIHAVFPNATVLAKPGQVLEFPNTKQP